jgi:hypothetical protein
MRKSTAKVAELPQKHWDALKDLRERGWEISWNGVTIKLIRDDHTIEANGNFRIVDVPGTRLSQSFKTAEEGIETIHTFAYIVEGHMDIARRWLDAIRKITGAKWTMDLIADTEALQMLETVAQRLTE